MATLILSPTGTIGKLLVQALLAKGAKHLRLLVRDAADAQKKIKIEQGQADRVEFFETKDYEDTSRDQELFANVERIWILYALPVPQQSTIERGIAERALKHSQVLKQIVKLSAMGVGEGEAIRYQAEAEQELWQLLRGHPTVSFTVLRPNLFMQNILRDDIQSIKTQNTIYRIGSVDPSYRISHVDVRDIADCAAVLLTAEDPREHANRFYTISGPESIDYQEYANILSEVLGKKIQVVFLSDAAAYQTFTKNLGVPSNLAFFLVQLYQLYRISNTTNHVFGDVELLTGKPARSFKSFVEDHRAALL